MNGEKNFFYNYSIVGLDSWGGMCTTVKVTTEGDEELMRIADESLKRDLELIVKEDLSIFAKIAKVKKLVKFLQKSGKVVKNIKYISDSYLKEKGIDAHAIKYGWLGDKAPIAKYDLYKDNKTGEIMIFLKGGKGDGIATGEFIK